jgi:hypothetical protein
MIWARQFAIIFGIAILYPALIRYSVGVFQPLPKIQNYTYVSVRIAPTTPEGWKTWEEEDRAEQKKHQEDLDAVDRATRPFFRVLILVATPLGIAAMFVGSYLKYPSVGTGLVLGGIISVTNAYWSYWNHLDDWIRYLSLLLGFGFLGFIGYHQFVAARSNPT